MTRLEWSEAVRCLSRWEQLRLNLGGLIMGKKLWILFAEAPHEFDD